jgi:pilus assembly protein Flp/PilA
MKLNFFKDESGATAIEYGLIAALIAVVCIVALQAVGGSLSNLFNQISTELGNATTPASPSPAPAPAPAP